MDSNKIILKGIKIEFQNGLELTVEDGKIIIKEGSSLPPWLPYHGATITIGDPTSPTPMICTRA